MKNIKIKYIVLICSCLVLQPIESKCQSINKTTENERFQYYELISDKIDTIEVYYIAWAASDRPTFILATDIEEQGDSIEVDDCFFMDTKVERFKKFPFDVIDNLQNGKKVRAIGKFYQTKKFDDIFPYKEYHPYSFEPKNGYYRVFVYEKIYVIP